MSIKATGFTKANANLERLARSKPEAFARGLLKAGLLLQRESQKLCPVDTGALRASAYTKLNGQLVTVPDEKGSDSPQGLLGGAIAKVKGILSRLFGKKKLGKSAGLPKVTGMVDLEVGYTMAYAVYVHEGVGKRFRVGQAKFLEQPARELRGRMSGIVRDEVRRG